MNGRKLYVRPATTATGVYRSEKSGDRIWASFNTPRIGPLSLSRICQLIVRIRKLVKNGAITRNNRTFLYRPPRNAIV
jgi:hypothetical protein